MTTLEIQTKKHIVIDQFPLHQILQLSGEDLLMTSEENKLVITYNRNKISSSDVVFHVMKEYRVLDFSVKETSIEDIIKKIYRNEV